MITMAYHVMMDAKYAASVRQYATRRILNRKTGRTNQFVLHQALDNSAIRHLECTSVAPYASHFLLFDDDSRTCLIG